MSEIEDIALLRDLEYSNYFDREDMNAFRYESITLLLNKFDDVFIKNRSRVESFFESMQSQKKIYLAKDTDNSLFYSSFNNASSMGVFHNILNYLNNKSGYYSHINNTFNEWIEKAQEYSIDTLPYRKKFDDIMTKILQDKEIDRFFSYYSELDDITAHFYQNIKKIKEGLIDISEDPYYKKLVKKLENPEPDNQKYQTIEFFDTLMERKKEYANNVQSIINELLTDIRKVVPTEFMTQAEHYIYLKDNSSISGFIEQKQTDEKIKIKFNMTKAQEIQSLFLFKDNSLVIKDKHDNYHSYNSLKDIQKPLDIFYSDYINYKLRKKPLFAPVFRDLFYKSGQEKAIRQTIHVINTFLDNYDVLKQKDLTAILANIKKNYKSEYALEMLDDVFNNIMREHKIKQFAQSIVSNKYIHLYNELSYEKFAEMIESGVTKEFIQQNIGKKLASFNTTEDFNKALDNIIALYNHFDIETIKQRAQESNTRVVSIEDNIMILEIKNFEQSKKMGSSSWCIVRDEYYFNSYTKEGNRQYFMYDFNLESSNHKSMIGITIEPNGAINTTHLKDDTYLSATNPIADQLAKKINKIERDLKQKNTIKLGPN